MDSFTLKAERKRQKERMALLVVCDWELAEARRKDAVDRARVRGERPPSELVTEARGIHSSVETDVKDLLEGKSHEELVALEIQIESDMRSGNAKVVEYWEAVLKRLHIYKAKACLKEIHAKMLRKHLGRLKKPLEYRDEVEESEPKEEDSVHEHDIDGKKSEQPPSPVPLKTEDTSDEEDEEDAEAGSFSPQLLHGGDDSDEALDPEEDKAFLVEAKQGNFSCFYLSENLKENEDSRLRPLKDENSVDLSHALLPDLESRCDGSLNLYNERSLCLHFGAISVGDRDHSLYPDSFVSFFGLLESTAISFEHVKPSMRYTLNRRFGRGAYGEVWLAFHWNCSQRVTAVGLTYVMGQRYMQTSKIMPAGLVSGISAVMTMFYAYKVACGGNHFPPPKTE